MPVPLTTSVQELGLSARTANKLERIGIRTLRDLLARKHEVTNGGLVMKVWGAGKKTQEDLDRNIDRLVRLAGPDGLAVMVIES